MVKKIVSKPGFPITLDFVKDPFVVSFPSPDEIKSWAQTEHAFWDGLTSGSDKSARHAILENTNRVTNVLRFQGNDQDFIALVQSLQKDYVPSGGGAGDMFRHLIQQKKKNIASIAYVLLFDPQAANFNFSNPEVAQAMSVAAAYHAVGSQIGAREKIERGIAEVNHIKSTFDEELSRMQNLATTADADWNNRIEGYEAKVALGSPREYWNARAVKHQTQAEGARRWWSWSLIAFVVITAALAIQLFTPLGEATLAWCYGKFGIQPPNPNNTTEPTAILSDFLKHAVIFGTFLGIGVWWLRQKLRELRSHEHLAEDAAERVTMIETYTAMKGAGLSAGDLSLVLRALYRPAATGLVHDDSGTPVLPLEILVDRVVKALAKGK